MRSLPIIGGIVLVAALTTAGCCTCRCVWEECDENYTPRTHTLKIVERTDGVLVSDLSTGNQVPACRFEPEGLDFWRGDTVILKNEYGRKLLIKSAPAPFKEEIVAVVVGPGDQKTLTVSPSVRHHEHYAFWPSCNPDLPGPGMRGDDPNRN